VEAEPRLYSVAVVGSLLSTISSLSGSRAPATVSMVAEGTTELGKAGANVSHHGIEGIIRDAGRDAWSVGAG